jgi:hypothetical protein
MTSTSEKNVQDLSLVLGGPVYRLLNWSRLADADLKFERRKIAVAILITWVPLLVLAIYEGRATSGNVSLSFLSDIALHSKFLVALPIILAAEGYVQSLISQRTRSFLKRNIIREEDVPKFARAIDDAHRLRDSWIVEIVLMVVVVVIGFWFWRSQIAMESTTWYADPSGDGLTLSLAGYWFVAVSRPINQFLTLRWYARFFNWFWFLRKVSKIDLNLVPTHPDRSGGLGFLGKATYAFGPILFAQGAILSGSIANEVIYNGRELLSFRLDAVLFILFFVTAVLSPLCVFIPMLVRTKRRGLGEFGALASKYTGAFEDKWFRGNNPGNEPVLGSGDIQSLADLGNSYAVVREMNMAPFVYKDALRLAATAAAPLLPLAFLIFSPDQILEKLMSFVL